MVQALRQEHPHLRIMVIPLMGEEIPPELAQVDLQGILSKPFFLPELPDRIQEAMSRPLGAGSLASPEPAVEKEPREEDGLWTTRAANPVI